MNIGNILKVADAIERASVPGLGFNMGVLYSKFGGLKNLGGGHDCGTVACIAGWALTVADVPFTEDVTQDMAAAAEMLGLKFTPWFEERVGEEAIGNALFIPDNYEDDIHTAEHAVRCLRNLAITGKVDWEAAMKGAEPILPPLPASRALVKQLS